MSRAESGRSPSDPTSPSGAQSPSGPEPLPPGALRIDITPHKRQPGTQRPFVERVAGLEGIELPSVEVSADVVDCDLNLEIVGEQLTATGTLSTRWTGPCRRCLEPMGETVTADVQEVFELEPVEGETYRREKDYVDLRPMVIEALVLALPVAPLCGDDCVGPAPDLFPTSVAAAPRAGSGSTTGADGGDHSDAPADPRWAALDGLVFDED